MSSRVCGVAPFLLLTLCVATVFAQNATTSLHGVIKDPSGAVLPGASITLLAPATGQKFSTTSNSSGEYELLQIPPAKYTITASGAGFAQQTKSAELLVEQPSTVNFTLSMTASNETVEISAAGATINTTNAALGGSTSNATIQALPSETRNVPDLLSLQPGVFYLPAPDSATPVGQDSRSGAVNGGRSDQGNVTLDGVDDNDQVNGYAFFGVLRETQDSIEEFNVTTGLADANAGRSSGAQISLITKSGTNKFHGAAYEYYRPPGTVANDFFNKNQELSEGLPNVPGKYLRNIFGADVGGPILKDKLFFFANYEGERIAEDEQVTQTTPTAMYQQGVLQYTSGGADVALSPSQVAQVDSGCQVCNSAAYSPGPGPNPNALGYLSSIPASLPSGNPIEGDGLNTSAFSFASPHPIDENTTILRIDYAPSDKQRIFARGGLQKDTTLGVEQFPGQGPSSKLVDNSKGIVFGDTWSISPKMVNDIRYGYIRQGSGNTGVGSGNYVDFRFITMPTAETRDTVLSSPVNNIVDNLNFTKGKHSIEVGVNWRLVHQNRSSNEFSFDTASTNPYWLGGTPPSPTTVGLPAVDGGFSNSYEIAYANLVGTVPSVTDYANYYVNSATSGTLLGNGADVVRHFKANEYEGYIQDEWRVQPNVVITYGVRYTNLQTPWETRGQEVAPTIDTHAWFQQREAAAQQGEVYEPNLTFAPSGPHFGRPSYWAKSKDNFAPRLAIVYSPDSKTSIRAGAGIYYDHYGEGLVNQFDQNGSFGLSSAVTNPAGTYTSETAPRFTARNSIPFSSLNSPSTLTYPYVAPFGSPQNPTQGFAITWGLDNKLKTPYSEAIDFSVQRELPGGFTIETAYVGRLGRHLLQSLDLAEPVDFVDPKGGGDYFTAGTQLSKDVDSNGGAYPATVAAIPYFEDVFPFMANTEYSGESATQAIYDLEWAPNRYGLGATTSLADLDFYCLLIGYNCPSNYQSKFWQGQFSSLYALSTIGMSYYNAGQVTLRHPTSHGLEADISYTFSKSIDMGSDAERTSEFPVNGAAYSESEILNTWKPYLNRAASDFDTRHLLTVDWVYQLPVGHGKAFLGNSGRLTDNLLGGWQLSGIFRATSGLPFSLTEPGYTTDWQIGSYAVDTGNIKAHKVLTPEGTPQYFGSASEVADINAGVYNGAPIRLPYPGEAGERNFFRGDGYFDLDSSLTKQWGLGKYGALKLTAEVYNVTNSVRFDPASIGETLTSGSLGAASAELTTPRRMQFALRYNF